METNNQRLLLDSHVFMWALEGVEKLGPKTQALIQSGIEVYVSKVSLWELAIKYRMKKFPYATNYLIDGIKLSGLSLLDIETEHLQTYSLIKFPHKDPFDLLLISQSISENLTFITADKILLRSSFEFTDASF